MNATAQAMSHFAARPAARVFVGSPTALITENLLHGALISGTDVATTVIGRETMMAGNSHNREWARRDPYTGWPPWPITT
jgi:hypothetical protein